MTDEDLRQKRLACIRAARQRMQDPVAESMAANRPIHREGFLKAVSQSGLFSANKITEFAHSKDGRELSLINLAARLIEVELLTEFQVGELLQSSSPMLMLGTYEIRYKIGSGGMGDVYLGYDSSMDRLVAIKVVAGAVGKAAFDRFKREMRVAARLKHPNIVQALHAGETNGRWYLVMEYVPGKNLSQVLSEKGRLSWRSALEYVKQAANGLAHAHECNIVHRDVKPANLLLDSGTVKVADVGLSCFQVGDSTNDDQQFDPTVADQTKTGQLLGTWNYMSPEQARNASAATSQSDIYSLGCVLYALLSGESPFARDSMVDTITAHQVEDVPSLPNRPRIPIAVDQLCRRMLAKSPGDRPASMGDVADEIDAIINAPEPTVSWTVGRSVAYVVLGLFLCSAIGFTWVNRHRFVGTQNKPNVTDDAAQFGDKAASTSALVVTSDANRLGTVIIAAARRRSIDAESDAAYVSELLMIDPENGQVERIGTLQDVGIQGLAYDVDRHLLFGCGYATSGIDGLDGQRYYLYEINPADATKTPIGQIGHPRVASLGYNATNDQLYATCNETGLLKIDRETGEGIAVGNLRGNASSLAYHPLTKQMFATCVTTKSLDLLDTATGARSQIKVDWNIKAYASAYDTERDTIFSIGRDRLYKVDPESGGFTAVASLPAVFSYSAMAVVPRQMLQLDRLVTLRDEYQTGKSIEMIDPSYVDLRHSLARPDFQLDTADRVYADDWNWAEDGALAGGLYESSCLSTIGMPSVLKGREDYELTIQAERNGDGSFGIALPVGSNQSVCFLIDMGDSHTCGFTTSGKQESLGRRMPETLYRSDGLTVRVKVIHRHESVWIRCWGAKPATPDERTLLFDRVLPVNRLKQYADSVVRWGYRGADRFALLVNSTPWNFRSLRVRRINRSEIENELRENPASRSRLNLAQRFRSGQSVELIDPDLLDAGAWYVRSFEQDSDDIQPDESPWQMTVNGLEGRSRRKLSAQSLFLPQVDESYAFHVEVERLSQKTEQEKLTRALSLGLPVGFGHRGIIFDVFSQRNRTGAAEVYSNYTYHGAPYTRLSSELFNQDRATISGKIVRSDDDVLVRVHLSDGSETPEMIYNYRLPVDAIHHPPWLRNPQRYRAALFLSDSEIRVVSAQFRRILPNEAAAELKIPSLSVKPGAVMRDSYLNSMLDDEPFVKKMFKNAESVSIEKAVDFFVPRLKNKTLTRDQVVCASERRVYRAPRANEAPKIDGVVDDVWATAPVEAGFRRLKSNAKSNRTAVGLKCDENSRLQIMWDDVALYVLYRSECTEWNGAVKDGEIDFTRDCFCMALDPNTDGELNLGPDGSDSYFLRCPQRRSDGADGAEERVRHAEVNDNSLQSGAHLIWSEFADAKIVQQNGNDGGILEMAIPWTQFDAGIVGLKHDHPPQIGQKWLFNLGRQSSRGSTSRDRSPVFNFHQGLNFTQRPMAELLFSTAAESVEGQRMSDTKPD